MNQISNIKVLEKPDFRNMYVLGVDSESIISKSLENHYLNLGKSDLSDLRLVFLEKFDYLLEFSEDKYADFKLYENIDSYFDFIDKNLAVYTELQYEQLSEIITIARVGIEDGVDLKSFYHFYHGYISLREDINRFNLSKKIYKEKRL